MKELKPSIPFPNPTERIVCLVGPSGAGKTALATQLRRRFPNHWVRPVRLTPRPLRPEEYFPAGTYRQVSEVHFNRLLAQGRLLAFRERHQHGYAYPLEDLERAFATGRIVLMEGQNSAQEIQQTRPGSELRIVTLFPFSGDLTPARLCQAEEVLEERLEKRGGLTPRELASRIASLEELYRKVDLADLVLENPPGTSLDRLAAKLEGWVARWW